MLYSQPFLRAAGALLAARQTEKSVYFNIAAISSLVWGIILQTLLINPKAFLITHSWAAPLLVWTDDQ